MKYRESSDSNGLTRCAAGGRGFIFGLCLEPPFSRNGKEGSLQRTAAQSRARRGCAFSSPLGGADGSNTLVGEEKGAAVLFDPRAFVVCYKVPRPSDGRINAVEILDEGSAKFQGAWKVNEPFCAIIRPDGFVAWAKKRASVEEIRTAIEHSAAWLVQR